MLLRLSALGFPIALSTLLTGAFATPAHAYLDPGTGSMILQVLLGGIAGVAVAGRFYWDRLLTMLGIRSRTGESESPRDASAPTRRTGE